MAEKSDRWIITTRDYVEHQTAEAMQLELDRLRKAHPERSFRVYRVQRNVKSHQGTGAHALDNAS